jgi:hypothetical protein
MDRRISADEPEDGSNGTGEIHANSFVPSGQRGTYGRVYRFVSTIDHGP